MSEATNKILGSYAFSFTGDSLSLPMKPIAEDDLTLKVHPYVIKFMMREAEYTGVTAFPLRELPVILDSTEISGRNIFDGLEGMVLPKGTIVSLVTSNTQSVAGSGINPSGIQKFDEYDRSLTLAMVPANGGSEVEYEYDDKYETLNIIRDGNTSGVLAIKGNRPYGIISDSIWQDVEGKFLNYARQKYVSTIKNARFEVPFVNTELVQFGDFDTKTLTADGESVTSPYYVLKNQYQFAMITSSTDSGSLLKSDKFGKFMIESDSLDATVTVQTVGKVQTIDCRFPKALDAMVQHYPGISLKGSLTRGIPTDLYVFVQKTLKALRLTYTADAVLSAIRSGAFGYITIDLEVK